MNKHDLIQKVRSRLEIYNDDEARPIVDAVLGGMMECLAEGRELRLVGFGTFGVRTRAARQGRNPKTGESLQIPEQEVIVFSAGKGLKEAVTPPPQKTKKKTKVNKKPDTSI